MTTNNRFLHCIPVLIKLKYFVAYIHFLSSHMNPFQPLQCYANHWLCGASGPLENRLVKLFQRFQTFHRSVLVMAATLHFSMIQIILHSRAHHSSSNNRCPKRWMLSHHPQIFGACYQVNPHARLLDHITKLLLFRGAPRARSCSIQS